jgi:hypothetical protein
VEESHQQPIACVSRTCHGAAEPLEVRLALIAEHLTWATQATNEHRSMVKRSPLKPIAALSVLLEHETNRQAVIAATAALAVTRTADEQELKVRSVRMTSLSDAPNKRAEQPEMARWTKTASINGRL